MRGPVDSYKPLNNPDITDSTNTRPVNQSTTKTLLRIPSSDLSQDGIITFLHFAAMDFMEKYTGLELFLRDWLGEFYVGGLGCCSYIATIRKKVMGNNPITITLIEYKNTSGIWTTWNSTNYTYTTDPFKYVEIYANTSVSLPSDMDYTCFPNFRVTFKAGLANMGTSGSVGGNSMSNLMREVFMDLVVYNFENRGDCPEAFQFSIPPYIKTKLNMYKQYRLW